MSKYRHRWTECLFNVANVFHFGFLGQNSQRLQGTLARRHSVLAVPDSGAERNIIDMRYARDKGFNIQTGPRHRNYVQFADGTIQRTVGQVITSWTFASGKRTRLTFEVLEDCCSDVIIGEEVLYRHNVFKKHAWSLVTRLSHSDCYELAPFDFISSWKRSLDEVLEKIKPNWRTTPRRPSLEDPADDASNEPHADAMVLDLEEQSRRTLWNFSYDFGATASAAEREAEAYRRRQNETGSAPEIQIPLVPSIPTSPARRQRTLDMAGRGSVPSSQR